MKVIGRHFGCGGRVFHAATSSIAWRFCVACDASTLSGHALQLAEDAVPKTSSGLWTLDVGEVGTVDQNGDPVRVG